MNDKRLERFIKEYKRERNAQHRLIIEILREIGLDVQGWQEARLCIRALLGR